MTKSGGIIAKSILTKGGYGKFAITSFLYIKVFIYQSLKPYSTGNVLVSVPNSASVMYEWNVLRETVVP